MTFHQIPQLKKGKFELHQILCFWNWRKWTVSFYTSNLLQVCKQKFWYIVRWWWRFPLNGAELSLDWVNSANSGNLINHWSMNWTQFKDPAFHMCLAGTMVASWSLTQDVAGSSPLMTNIFITESTEFSENIKEKVQYVCVWLRTRWHARRKAVFMTFYFVRCPACCRMKTNYGNFSL